MGGSANTRAKKKKKKKENKAINNYHTAVSHKNKRIMPNRKLEHDEHVQKYDLCVQSVHGGQFIN